MAENIFMMQALVELLCDMFNWSRKAVAGTLLDHQIRSWEDFIDTLQDNAVTIAVRVDRSWLDGVE